MKKIISLLLALMMLVATFAVIVIPTSAVTGAWSVYTCRSQYLEGYSGVVHNIAGYKYVQGEGLKTISPSAEESENTTPYVTVQTTEKVDIRAGVYMKVRVDDFTYEGDSLFAFSIWDQQGVEPGKQGDDYGYGVETLIRPINEGSIEHLDDNRNTWPGALNTMEWFSDVEAGIRERQGWNSATSNSSQDVDGNDLYVYNDDYNEFDENRDPIFTLEIKWNSEKNICEAFINGAPAPDGFNNKMSDYFKPDNYYAHIGFTMYNSALGGVAECTVLEFGESSEDWDVPDGDDSADPEVFPTEFAEIAPATDVPEGDPAIRFTGDPDDSDIKGKPSAYNGNVLTIQDNGFVNVQAPTSGSATVEFRVKDDVSYDIVDFPIILFITKNFCTCEYMANDQTGELEKHCNAAEKIRAMVHAGANMASNQDYQFTSLDNTYFESYKDSEDNSYLYFMFDTSILESENNVAPLEGRIHGVRVDVTGLAFPEAERNNFDVCEVAYFRDTNEAEDYAKLFIENVEDIGGDFGDDTEADTEEDTEEDTEVDTEVDTDEATDEATEVNTDEATDEGTEVNTDEATDEGTDVTPDTNPETNESTEGETEPEIDEGKTTGKTDENTEGQPSTPETPDSGCGSAVGFGAIAVAMTTAIALVSFRKKED